MTTAKVAARPCPRCGCHIVKYFECGCGACKDDYCANCGRFCSLEPSEHVELSPYDVRCGHGNVPHAHDEGEKAARIRAWMVGIAAQVRS